MQLLARFLHIRVYFLQIFDKVVFGLGNTWGLSKDLNLTGERDGLRKYN